MDTYARWFAEQERFYRIMFLAMVLFGGTVAATGAVTANVVFVGLGICWIFGGGVLVVFLANRDPQSG